MSVLDNILNPMEKRNKFIKSKVLVQYALCAGEKEQFSSIIG